MTGEFPAQRTSNAEIVFSWWRHNGFISSSCSYLSGCCAHNGLIAWLKLSSFDIYLAMTTILDMISLVGNVTSCRSHITEITTAIVKSSQHFVSYLLLNTYWYNRGYDVAIFLSSCHCKPPKAISMHSDGLHTPIPVWICHLMLHGWRVEIFVKWHLLLSYILR